jgi:hypothetical protein
VARVNGQEHAHEAEKWLTTSHHHTDSSSPADTAIALHTALQAQAHATLAVAYAQAGAWADIPSPQPTRLNDPENRLAKIATHIRESTDEGPDYCGPCSSAIGDWVPWPCAGSVSSGPCLTYGCVRTQGHDGNHVAANGIDWPDDWPLL